MSKIYLAILGAVLLTACSHSEVSNKPVAVKTGTVKSIPQQELKRFSFIAQPHHTTQLAFRVGGVVNHFEAYSGTYFKAGELIAAIDRRDFVIRKERAEAQLNLARAEYARVKSLYEKNNVAASQYDKAYTEYVTAKTAYEMASNEVADTRLVAPFNGYVGETYIEKHQDVKATERIVSLVNIEQLRIEVYVNQEIASRASEIDCVTLQFDALPHQRYQAKVVEVSKNTTRNNLSYLLTALLPNGEGALLPGMSGEVIFEGAGGGETVVIPQTALSYRPSEGNFVWCIDPTSGIASKRHIEMGRILSEGMVEVKANLQEGETIALTGLRFLAEGAQVTPLP